MECDLFKIAITKLDEYFAPRQSKMYKRHLFRQLKQLYLLIKCYSKIKYYSAVTGFSYFKLQRYGIKLRIYLHGIKFRRYGNKLRSYLHGIKLRSDHGFKFYVYTLSTFHFLIITHQRHSTAEYDDDVSCAPGFVYHDEYVSS